MCIISDIIRLTQICQLSRIRVIEFNLIFQSFSEDNIFFKIYYNIRKGICIIHIEFMFLLFIYNAYATRICTDMIIFPAMKLIFCIRKFNQYVEKTYLHACFDI